MAALVQDILASFSYSWRKWRCFSCFYLLYVNETTQKAVLLVFKPSDVHEVFAGFTSCCQQAEQLQQHLIRLENTAKPQLPVERRRPMIKLFIYNAEISRCLAFQKPQTQMAVALLRFCL